uniref:Uncharacterized protein n=1 Tax=Sus scrofa TaxID=9823 RepID=A0A8D1W2U9_PIG
VHSVGTRLQITLHKSDLGDGEEVVKTHIFTTRLSNVALKLFLLIFPHVLCCHHVDQQTEDEHNRQPDPPNPSGVFIYSTEKVSEEHPAHDSGSKEGKILQKKTIPS